MNRLTKKIFIHAKMKLKTGVRIGDNKSNVEIGGVDNSLIRNKITNQPYIPGSSLKGKIRSLLQLVHGEEGFTGNSVICRLFGSAGDSGKASRIIVRDAELTDDSVKILKNSAFTDMPFTEIKTENVIDRIKGTAKDPRQMERVPAGAAFNVSFVINIHEDENEAEFLTTLFQGIALLENDYLGSSGSRGYGQVVFENFVAESISFELKEKEESKDHKELTVGTPQPLSIDSYRVTSISHTAKA